MLAQGHSTRKEWRWHSSSALSDSKIMLWVIRLFCLQSDKILCIFGNCGIFKLFLPNTPPPLSSWGSLRGISGLREAQGLFQSQMILYGSAIMVLRLPFNKDHLSLHPSIPEEEKKSFFRLWAHGKLNIGNWLTTQERQRKSPWELVAAVG